jgi:ubiquinone/menaquinone biosynthesis C-methylase UbiE
MRTKVFISYSHKDRPWLDRLQVFLRPLERDGLIERWDDTRIRAGDGWRDEIRRAIASARVVVLLISADFLASDFVEREELPPLLAQARDQGARIIPVIVGHCMLDGPNANLMRFQAINPPNEPLEQLSEPERNRVWTKLTREIFSLLPPTPHLEPPTPPEPPVSEPGRSGHTPPSRHALLVINDRCDDPIYGGLTQAAEEPLPLEAVLRDPAIGGFEVTVVRNEATAGVKKAVRQFFAAREPGDVALLYYAGPALQDQDYGIFFATRDASHDDPNTAVPIGFLQHMMRTSRSRCQVVLLDCVYARAHWGNEAAAGDAARGWLASFQGEGRFVLSSSPDPTHSWRKDGPPPLPQGSPTGAGRLAAALTHGLRSGKADVERDRKVTVDELFCWLEEAVASEDPERPPARWAFDQSNADLVLAEAGLPGDDQIPTPIVKRYTVSQDIRQPVFDLTVPTYILDRHFYLLDWNPAFDELVAQEIKLVRGQDHAKTFVQALTNCEEVVRHAQEVFGGAHYPLIDTEELVFPSCRYGQVRFRKVAAQIADGTGDIKGWSVSLDVIDAEDSARLWHDMLARIEDEVGWSRYGVVYDDLLLQFPDYRALVQQVAGLVGGSRRCIDLGAGTGNGTIELLRDPEREVWAVEINETMLHHLRAKLAPSGCEHEDRLTVVKDNLTRLDALPRAYFDAAVMTNVLYAVRDRQACLRQVNRVLKPHGVLALSTPHRGTDVDRLFKKLREALERQGVFEAFREQFDAARSRHHAMLHLIQRDTVDDTLEMLHEAGFEVEATIPDQYAGAVVVLKAVKVREVREATVPRATCAVPRGDAVSQMVTSGKPARDEDVRDVFVSYATEDRAIADDIRAYLEREEIPCWIAPRDIQPGDNFPAKIVHAIDRSRVFILVLSAAANRSSYAAREVARAADGGIPIVPFRAEDVPPSDSLALYLSNVHWLDAFSGPRPQHLQRLAQTIKCVLSTMAGATAEAAARAVCETGRGEDEGETDGGIPLPPP